jgi:hypothetical protein
MAASGGFIYTSTNFGHTWTATDRSSTLLKHEQLIPLKVIDLRP